MATKGSCNHFLPIRQFIFWRPAVDITLMCVCVYLCVGVGGNHIIYLCIPCLYWGYTRTHTHTYISIFVGNFTHNTFASRMRILILNKCEDTCTHYFSHSHYNYIYIIYVQRNWSLYEAWSLNPKRFPMYDNFNNLLTRYDSKNWKPRELQRLSLNSCPHSKTAAHLLFMFRIHMQENKNRRKYMSPGLHWICRASPQVWWVNNNKQMWQTHRWVRCIWTWPDN